MTFRQLINYYTIKAKEEKLEPQAVKILIQELSGYDNVDFLLNLDTIPCNQLLDLIKTSLNEYLINKKPIQYILGYAYFCGYQFKVNEDVLIPRQETEELVEHLLKTSSILFNNHNVSVLDVGTGSGAIAVSIAKKAHNMKVYASDISSCALAVAKSNASTLNADVTFFESDMLDGLLSKKIKFDIIVSNPPYVKFDEYVDPMVLDNEPHLALFAKDDGMYFYERILKDAKKILNFPNMIIFEHGAEQKQLMNALAKKYFESSSITTLKDINGKDRITIIINR